MHFIALLRFLTRVENRKTAHAVVVNNAHCYQSFSVSRTQLRITGGSPFNTAKRQKPTIRSGNKCLEDSAFSKEVDKSNILQNKLI